MMVVTDVVVHMDILKLLHIMESLVNVNECGGFGTKNQIDLVFDFEHVKFF